MKNISILLAILFILSGPISSLALEIPDIIKKPVSEVKEDYRNFYLDSGNILRFGAALSVAGITANSSADREVQEYFQDNIRSGPGDDASDIMRIPGEALVTLPLTLGAYLISDGPAGEWGKRSLRALFLGGPAGLIVQRATGGGRPREGDSHWRPFKNNNGLSGHAFIGAVPFITAARMQENVYFKGLLYGASILPGLSRINDNEHFISQAAIGWYLAYLSAAAVEGSKTGAVSILPFKNGLTLSYRKVF
ncbi:MAG: hypothetical protein HY954_10975 [Deltaproteobacteria bacterium]|nr:hypothetical protein [Deltaproteobacteria bacterium]